MGKYMIVHGDDGDTTIMESASEDVIAVLDEYRAEHDPDHEEQIHSIFCIVDLTPEDMSAYAPVTTDVVIEDKPLPAWWDKV